MLSLLPPAEVRVGGRPEQPEKVVSEASSHQLGPSLQLRLPLWVGEGGLEGGGGQDGWGEKGWGRD